MDPFHQRLAQVALEAAARTASAWRAGTRCRRTVSSIVFPKDVDLFTTMAAASDFSMAQAAVVAALRADGLTVSVQREGASFARLAVTDPGAGSTSTVELGVDWRAHPPVRLAIGPVLHPADAVANKLCALFARAEVRDYIDVHGVLDDGRFTTHELLRMAADHDPGFDRSMFVEALRAVRRFPSRTVIPDEYSPDRIIREGRDGGFDVDRDSVPGIT